VVFAGTKSGDYCLIIIFVLDIANSDQNRSIGKSWVICTMCISVLVKRIAYRRILIN